MDGRVGIFNTCEVAVAKSMTAAVQQRAKGFPSDAVTYSLDSRPLIRYLYPGQQQTAWRFTLMKPKGMTPLQGCRRLETDRAAGPRRLCYWFGGGDELFGDEIRR